MTANPRRNLGGEADAQASEDRQMAAGAGYLRDRGRGRCALSVAARADSRGGRLFRQDRLLERVHRRTRSRRPFSRSTCRRPDTGSSNTSWSTSTARQRRSRPGCSAFSASARRWRATASAAPRFRTKSSRMCCRVPGLEAAPAARRRAVAARADGVQPSQDPGIAAILDDDAAGRARHAGDRGGPQRPHRRRTLRRGLFAGNAAARLVDDQVGERGDHRHAGQIRKACRRPASNCWSRGRPTAAPRSASPT